MSTSTTTNLGLVLDNADEPVKTHHRHANANLATIDVTIKSLQDSMGNAKALLGQLGIDAEEHYAVDAETARTTLGVPSLSDIDDIVRQNIPLMSPTTLGGAKLEEHGGLVLRDEKLGIGSLVQESDGAVRGGIAGLTAEGHAEQLSTTGKNLLALSATTRTVNGTTVTISDKTRVVIRGTSTSSSAYIASGTQTITQLLTEGQTYTISLTGAITNGYVQLNYVPEGGDDSLLAKTSGNPVTFTVPSNVTRVNFFVGVSGAGAASADVRIQLEAGSTATAYEPYSGGLPSPRPDWEQPIEVVSGRNLLDVAQKASTTYQGVTYSVEANNRLVASGTATGTNTDIDFTIDSDTVLKSGETYTLSFEGIFEFSAGVTAFIKGTSWTNIGRIAGSRITFTLGDDISLNTVKLRAISGTANVDANIQLTLGSTPQPYVPYGHVGLEVRDANDQLLSTTPIPLPSRGWVGSLPDGTADTLTLDGAGKVEWELKDEEVVLDGSEDWALQNSGTNISTAKLDSAMKPSSSNDIVSNLICSNFTGQKPGYVWLGIVGASIAMANTGKRLRFADGTGAMTIADWTTWLQSNPVTVLYPLATPVTESCGYVNMPVIQSDAIVTIPELDALGVKYFVDDSVTEYGREIYARGQHDLSETNGEIDTLEASIAPVESVVATSNHSVGDYFMLGNVLMRTTTAIATGERITAINATPATMQSQIDTIRDSVGWKSHTVTKSDKIQTLTTRAYSVGKIVVVSYYFISDVDLIRNDTIATFDLPSVFVSNFFDGSANLKGNTKTLCADTSFTSGVGYYGLLVGVMK